VLLRSMQRRRIKPPAIHHAELQYFQSRPKTSKKPGAARNFHGRMVAFNSPRPRPMPELQLYPDVILPVGRVETPARSD
jgi:hypothetical protein